jgi:hypothetical protein
MANEKKNASNVVIEVLEGSAGSFVELEAGRERDGIILAIAHRIGRDVEYKVCRVEGPNRTPVLSATLGYQITRYSPAWNARDGLPPAAAQQPDFERRGLEEMPFLQVVLTIDATLITLQQKYSARLDSDPTIY